MLEGNGAQVLVQLIGVLSTLVYGFVVSVLILKGVDLAIGLRVTEEQERQGLDVSLHGRERVLPASRAASSMLHSGGANAGNHTSLSGRRSLLRNRREYRRGPTDRHSLPIGPASIQAAVASLLIRARSD